MKRGEADRTPPFSCPPRQARLRLLALVDKWNACDPLHGAAEVVVVRERPWMIVDIWRCPCADISGLGRAGRSALCWKPGPLLIRAQSGIRWARSSRGLVSYSFPQFSKAGQVFRARVRDWTLPCFCSIRWFRANLGWRAVRHLSGRGLHTDDPRCPVSGQGSVGA